MNKIHNLFLNKEHKTLEGKAKLIQYTNLKIVEVNNQPSWDHLNNFSYKSYLEVGVRNFIKGYLAEFPCFGLKGSEFKRYNDLISFIYGFADSPSPSDEEETNPLT